MVERYIRRETLPHQHGPQISKCIDTDNIDILRRWQIPLKESIEVRESRSAYRVIAISTLASVLTREDHAFDAIIARHSRLPTASSTPHPFLVQSSVE